GVQDAGSAYFYTRDHLGSVTELTDVSGVVRARYAYDPAGRSIKVSGDRDSVFGYANLYVHSATHLSLAQYRAYDPNFGRWLSQDPIDHRGPTLYSYALNNPIGFVDPDGLLEAVMPGSGSGG